MGGGKEEEWAAVYHKSALKILNSVSGAMVTSQHMDLSHSFYSYTWTLSQGLMKISYLLF